MAQVLFEVFGNSGGDLAQGVYGIGVEDEPDLIAARPQGFRHGLRHEHFA
jgi:hypothetical protein